MTSIDVRCSRAPDAGPWRCVVAVDDGRTSGTHTVSVRPADAARLAGADDATAIERLVRDTFGFLLEREPRSSILPAFDLMVVGRYFPEFEAEIRRRLGR